VAVANKGNLADASEKSWDVSLASDAKIQVKCRVIAGIGRRSETFSPFRSWDFHSCVFVLLDSETYDVVQAVELPCDVVRGVAYDTAWVRGQRLTVSQLRTAVTLGKDVTAQIRHALESIYETSVQCQLRGAGGCCPARGTGNTERWTSRPTPAHALASLSCCLACTALRAAQSAVPFGHPQTDRTEMADWTNVVSAGVGVAGLSYGFYERYFGSRRSLRIGKIKEVLRDREDKVLFSESIPDEALRPLAASAKEFRLKCSEAKALTRSGSSVRHDLKTCLDAAALFEYQVQQMLKQLERSDPSLRSDPNVFVYADDKKHLDDLKAQLRDTTREPASRLATSL
jgi:hypothetical protein